MKRNSLCPEWILVALTFISVPTLASAQTICPAEEYAYNLTIAQDSRASNQYYKRPSCATASAMVQAKKARIYAGRAYDNCLCSLGSCLPPDNSLVNAYNGMAKYYNKACVK